MIKPALFLLLLIFTAHAEEGYDPANPFTDKRLTPMVSTTGAQSYGFYSHGCVIGAVPITPENDDDWVLMHPSRHRYFGMPEMLDFMKYLSKANGRIGVGDVGQADGGPTIGGHASHEMGLDVDLRYEVLPKGVPFSPKEREDHDAVSVAVQQMTGYPKNPQLESHMIAGAWNPQLSQLLRTAAEYPGTERIFVSPPVKKQLCEEFKDNPAWLAKLRPYYDHMDHFHVRLACPALSTKCEKQDPVPIDPKDPTHVGCAGPDIDWWTDPNLKPLKKNDKASNPSYLNEQLYDAIHENDPPKPNQPPPVARWKKQLGQLPQECKDLQVKIQQQLDGLTGSPAVESSSQR